MNRILKWAAFLRPSVQRDLVALVNGCLLHPANRLLRHPPRTWHGIGPASCPSCDDLYAAKQRVKRLLG